MENDFTPPTFEEVREWFKKKTGDDNVSESLTRRFFEYYEKNNWTVKVGKNKRAPMKIWSRAANTFIKNMPAYSKAEHIRLISKRITGV